MVKKRLDKDDVLNLDHMIQSLKEAEVKLEEYHEKKDPMNFNKTKKLMLTIQKKIAEVVK
tara:strand:- start:66 stop:245 length:180 start_codon:yes stop_codon:yes gene_type:complete